jgi:putative transposase
VNRNFTASRPDQLWVADFTYCSTWSGVVYVAFITDVLSRRIVGWKASRTMTATLVVDALNMAAWTRRHRSIEQLTCHTDRGSQFRANSYVRTLKNNGLIGSMGRVGVAGDNAAMESFFSLLQNNVLDNQRWETREELRLAIVTWIERTYHRRRRQRELGKPTPIEFEALDVALEAA